MLLMGGWRLGVGDVHFGNYIVPLKLDRIWLWVYHNDDPIYLTFYLLKGD